MNADVKAKWVAALRSGEYKKGSGNLRAEYPDSPDPIQYCCLGVLCELSPFESQTIGYVTEWDENSTYLPPSVQQWAGLDMCNPVVPFDDRELTLADVNDRTEATFDDIANLIEEHL